MKLKIIMTFALESFLHVAGDLPTLGIDKSIYLDPIDRKTPAIPASSLKGILRTQVERLLRAKGKNICESPRPEKMCMSRENACLVCKYFGSPRIKSSLIFQDAKLEKPKRDARYGVGIERKRKTAKEGHLFSYEISTGESFSTEIKGAFETTEEAYVASALLFLGAKSSFAAGGGESRGLGWIELKESKIFINDEEVSKKEVEHNLGEVLKL